MKKFATALIAITAVLTAHSALAQGKPGDAIRYRQAAFMVMAKHFGSLGAMANGKAPYDAKVAASDAEVLAVVHPLPFNAFGPGTDKGAKTEAKPAVWQKAEEFNKDVESYKAEMPKLLEAAKSGDAAALKTAFGPAAKTCKTCHDTFREKD
jgi:cytochrome c556